MANAIDRKALQRVRAYRTFRFPEKTYIEPLTPFMHAESGESADLASPPPSVDWRTLVSIAPAHDQGTCNTCTSFSLASAIEILWLRDHPGAPISVSAGYIHTCLGHAGTDDAATICSLGVDLYAGLRLLKSRGFALGKDPSSPLSPGACHALQGSGRLKGFAPVQSANDAKLLLANAGPLVADMYVWEDFFSFRNQPSSAYSPDLSRAGPYLHSVCVIGYSGSGWLVKNSFGPTWGDGTGCATIAYGACALLGAPPPSSGVRRQSFSVRLAG